VRTWSLPNVGASLLTATAVLCSCSNSATLVGGQGRDNGVAVIALANDPDTLDPTLAGTFVARAVFTTFCEKLYDVDEHLQLVPQLAADLPGVSADGLTVRIPLRNGIKFNDGTEFNAEAVKTTLDRNLTLPTSARKHELGGVEQVVVVDPGTVEIKLKRPYSPLTAQLADRAGAIMSPTALRKLGNDFGTAPVCVGPFNFTKRIPGSEIDFTKSDDYYDKSKVKLHGIKYVIVTDPNVRTANLRSGDLNAAEQINPSDVPYLESDPHIRLQKADTIAYETLSVNVDPSVTSSPLASSAPLRRAFEMSIDREALNKVVFFGQASADCNPLPVDQPFRPAEIKCTAYDPEGARAIVAQSGHHLPIPVDLLVSAKQPDEKIAEVIQQMTKHAGFDVKIQPVELAAANDLADTGKFDVYLVSWSGRIDPDGYFTDVVTTGGSINDGRIADHTLDQLVADAAAMSSHDERVASYRSVLDRLQSLNANIYLYHPSWFLGLNGLTGVRYGSDAIPRLKTAELAR
jgi:peptide/nickel transport system substrate-binding protein